MVDAAVARAFAQGRVPSGITKEYLEQTRDEPAIIGILIIVCLVTIVLGFRYYSRVLLVKSFGLDDGLAGLSYACYVTFVVLCIILIKEGSGRHIEYIEYVLTESQTDTTEINDYVAHLIYTSALFICRLSGLAFFSRLCSRHKPLLRGIRAAVVFLVCAFIPQFLLILLHCNPVTGLWPYGWQNTAADYKCVTWGTVYVTNSGLSLVCDFVVFTIPVVMITLLKLSRGRKIMLACVLMPGVVVIGISCTRLWLCVVGQWASDGSWYYNPQLAIEVAEIGATLMALSVPALKPMAGKCYEKMRSTNNSSRRQSEPPDPETGRERKMSEPAPPPRKPAWFQVNPLESSQTKTSVNAASTTVEGSSRASDEDLLGPRDIVVQTDVNQTYQRSVPLTNMRTD